MNKFNELNISKELVDATLDMGFKEMSPIQRQAIPVILEGRDIMGQAQTGTGKTAAFGIPLIEAISGGKLEGMVLCPTRELSIQVSKEIKKLAKYRKDIRVLPIYGGQPIARQINSLKEGVEIVVGTPGRIIDHIKRKTLKLNDISMIVLDEADEMFNMGFRDDMKFIMDRIQGHRQTIFFSATMDRDIINFAKRYQKKPRTIKVVQEKLTVSRIEQYYYNLNNSQKLDALNDLIEVYNPDLSIVFCNTKRGVDRLVGNLNKLGHQAGALHGDLRQGQRDRVMKAFRQSKIKILVATDVAARGIDVDEVDAVFNYDIPEDLEYYVHRIGRTARAGRKGYAFNFVTNRDRKKIREIEAYTKTKIKKASLPTSGEIENLKISKLSNLLEDNLASRDVKKYNSYISKIEDGGLDIYTIAASLLKLYLDGAELGEEKERKFNNFAGNHSRIYFNTGKKMGVAPAHLLAAITEGTGIKGDRVGKIDIFENFSFVEVPKEEENNIISSLNGSKIKGRTVKVQKSKSKK